MSDLWRDGEVISDLFRDGEYVGYVTDTGTGKFLGYVRLKQRRVTKYAITARDRESAKANLLAFLDNQKAMASLHSMLVEMLDSGGFLNYVDTDGRVHAITGTNHGKGPIEKIRVTPGTVGFKAELMTDEQVMMTQSGLTLDHVLDMVLATTL